MPVLVGLVLIAMLIGAGAAAVYFTPFGTQLPTIVKGTIVATSHDATQIGLHVDGTAEGVGYEIAGAHWIDRNGQVNGGSRPECIIPGSTGQRIELAYVRVRGTDDGPGISTLVAWVRCL
ncbi:hypothetical protein ABZ260_48085 [Streptosporangium sp. NPDC006013]|uniref:hypothetical protein n=1 Tax=Streptosporangium sp. NPDC006013 TaxID=3155596 RepID=UPI0033B06054